MISYVFTFTFKSMTCREKFKLIDDFQDAMKRLVDSSSRSLKKTHKANLYYAVEYHRRAKHKHTVATSAKHLKTLQNVTAPHVHGRLVCRKLPRDIEDNILRYFRDNWGRSQFSIQEDLEEIQGWDEYCQKEVAANDENYPGYNHFRACTFNYGVPFISCAQLAPEVPEEDAPDADFNSSDYDYESSGY